VVVGTPVFTATAASVNGHLVVTVTNTSAPGNTATWTLDVTRLSSIVQRPHAGDPAVITIAGAAGSAATPSTALVFVPLTDDPTLVPPGVNYPIGTVGQDVLKTIWLKIAATNTVGDWMELSNLVSLSAQPNITPPAEYYPVGTIATSSGDPCDEGNYFICQGPSNVATSWAWLYGPSAQSGSGFNVQCWTKEINFKDWGASKNVLIDIAQGVSIAGGSFLYGRLTLTEDVTDAACGSPNLATASLGYQGSAVDGLVSVIDCLTLTVGAGSDRGTENPLRRWVLPANRPMIKLNLISDVNFDTLSTGQVLVQIFYRQGENVGTF
jgi:hypothetical protein